MATKIYFPNVSALTVATAVADSTEYVQGNFAGGVIEIPTGSSLSLLTFYHSLNSTEDTATYLPLYDEDGNAVTLPVTAGRSYVQPAALNVCAYLKVVGNVAGTINWLGKTL